MFLPATGEWKEQITGKEARGEGTKCSGSGGMHPFDAVLSHTHTHSLTLMYFHVVLLLCRCSWRYSGILDAP